MCLHISVLYLYKLKIYKKNYEYLNITSFQLSVLVPNESFESSRSIIFQIHIFYFSDFFAFFLEMQLILHANLA